VRALVVLFAVVACQQTIPPPPAETAPAAPAVVAHTPFVIANQIVAEDGTVVRTLADTSGFQAVPVGPHRFELGGDIIDTATNTVTKRFEPAELRRVLLFGRQDHDVYELVRREADGRERWATRITGVRSVRPPDIAVGGGRVVVSIDNKLHAFDDATGKLVWLGDDGDRVHVAGDAVISVRCNEPTHDHWLIANALADGKQRWKVALADRCDPWVAVDHDRIFVVEDRDPPASRIYDFKGALIASLAEQIEGSHREPWGGSHVVGDALVIVTDQHIMALDAAGHALWRRAGLRDTFVAADQIVALPGGDMIVANYGAISDSGVDLVRLHPDGSLAWHACTFALGVPHSKYSHLAYVEPRGDALFVVSQGASGAFLERLSLASGARELRCVMGEPKCSPPPPGSCQ
jgi:outer membrane protein assembly factor BamB